MDIRLCFDEDAQGYERFRPTYPKELFEHLFAYAKLALKSSVLEIGIGTGQATPPFLTPGCDVTAVELGERLSAYVRQKFAAYDHFHLIQGDFMQCSFQEAAFDLVYSATAFHWLPQEQSYQRVWEMLKPHGTIALFWNHPFVNRPDDRMHQEIRKAYRELRPGAPEKPTEFKRADCAKYTDLLTQNGFGDVEAMLYHQTRSMSAGDYVQLLNTYSDHRTLSMDMKLRLETRIADAINRYGGSLTIYDTIDLYLARRSFCVAELKRSP